MKIIHIAEFDLHFKTGIGEIVIELTHNQQQLGHQVKIFLLNNQNQLSNRDNELYIDSSKNFNDTMISFNPDLIIFHSFYKPAYLGFYKKILHYKKPFAIQPHGAFSIENQKKGKLKKTIANIFFFKKFIINAAGIIYLNQAEKASSIFKAIAKKNVIIPNGIYLPQIPNHQKELKVINISFLSRIDIRHKGIDILLSSLKKYEKELQQYSLKIRFYGYGKQNDIIKVKQLINNINLNIKYKGSVFKEDKITVFNNTDIYILTSRYEGMPMSILEALSFSIPCIISIQTNMADIIKKYNAGWVTELKNDNIAHTIINAIQEYKNNHIALKKNARASVEENYTWEKIAATAITQYKTLLSVE